MPNEYKTPTMENEIMKNNSDSADNPMHLSSVYKIHTDIPKDFLNRKIDSLIKLLAELHHCSESEAQKHIEIPVDAVEAKPGNIFFDIYNSKGFEAHYEVWVNVNTFDYIVNEYNESNLLSRKESLSEKQKIIVEGIIANTLYSISQYCEEFTTINLVSKQAMTNVGLKLF